MVGGNRTGSAGLSVHYGEAGNEVITAGKGIAFIFDDEGNDTLNGAKGVSLLTGGDGSDRITAGARGFDINGGAGADKLFAGAGNDIFHFDTGFGRDNSYKFDIDSDLFEVGAPVNKFEDMTITGFNEGVNTPITFNGTETGTKIILHDGSASSLTANHFLFRLRTQP